jgi:hypothetical protein
VASLAFFAFLSASALSVRLSTSLFSAAFYSSSSKSFGSAFKAAAYAFTSFFKSLMKFSYTLIVAALLGNISQTDLVSAVQLNHRHHHKHHAKQHRRHYPKNIGVRFVQSMEEGVGSAADPSVVEDAAPETEATKVAEEAAVVATKKSQEAVAAVEETIKKASETKPAPEPTE